VTDGEPRVVVVVSVGCHLCDDACAIVDQVCETLAIAWTARDLGELDEALRVKWREYTPVVLIDGEVHDIFRVSAERLRAALSG
jgi:Glutaredoxin-like domain (DUF836)